MLYRLLTLLAVLMCSAPVFAADAKQPDLNRLTAVLGGEKPDSISPTAIPGLYEVIYKSEVFYISQDGRFAIQGDMLDLANRNNLTEHRRDAIRAKAIAGIGENKAIVFSPAGAVTGTVTVFTDIDCAYCRKFHREIAEYNRNGIKVRYLMYPRAGVGSESYDKAVSVWCSPDPQAALTKAKQGEDLEQKVCPNPVKEEYELGQALGIQGTPTIILEDGRMIPGYISPTELARVLSNREKSPN